MICSGFGVVYTYPYYLVVQLHEAKSIAFTVHLTVSQCTFHIILHAYTLIDFMYLCEWATDQVDSRPQLRVRWRLCGNNFEFLSKRSAEVRCDDSYEYNNKVEQSIFSFFLLYNIHREFLQLFDSKLYHQLSMLSYNFSPGAPRLPRKESFLIRSSSSSSLTLSFLLRAKYFSDI